jgi:AraC-like DNA-binding protein
MTSTAPRRPRPDRSLRAETPMAFVRAIVLAYEKYGVDPCHALRLGGITPAQLRRPEARIDADRFEAVAITAMQQLDDEALGWFSRRLPWGSYGLLCRGSLGAPTLGVALARWCRHHRLLTQDILPALVVDRHGARLTLSEGRDLGPMREFCLLSSFRYVHGYACWLVNSRLPLREITFPFAPPPHASVFPLLFPGPVRFDAAEAAIHFDERYLTLSPMRDEHALSVMLQHALRLTVRQYRRDQLLVARVREQLADPRGGASTAETLADALHLSVRSLHRQLALEGTSLQAIKDAVHRDRALDLLGRTSLPVKQLARAVGFASEKSFARAFKLWTGESPSEHRRRLGRL